MRGRSLAILLAVLCLVPAGASAQLSREEQATPPPATPNQQTTPEDEARTLLELARRLETQGQVTAARQVLRDIVDHYDGTLSAAEALEMLKRLPADGSPGEPVKTPPPAPSTGPAPRSPRQPMARPGALDQTGRVPVIVYSTVLSSYLALSIPIVANAKGSPAYGLALLTGAPIGLLSSIYLTRHRQVTAAQADLFMLGGNWGLFHGLAFGIISDGESREVAGAAALGGLLGAGTGALLAAPGRNRESTVALAGLGTTYGAWLGLIATEIATPNNSNMSSHRAFAGMLIGGDAALVGSVLAGPNITLSRNRARLIGLGAASGSVIGLAFDLLFKVDGRQQAWGMVGAGTLAGLAGGVALTSEYDTKRGFTDPPRAEFLPPGLVPLRGGGVGLELLSARF